MLPRLTEWGLRQRLGLWKGSFLYTEKFCGIVRRLLSILTAQLSAKKDTVMLFAHNTELSKDVFYTELQPSKV